MSGNGPAQSKGRCMSRLYLDHAGFLEIRWFIDLKIAQIPGFRWSGVAIAMAVATTVGGMAALELASG